MVVPYHISRGCTATYFPEANVLVPIDQTAATSNTPVSKSIVISIAPSADPAVAAAQLWNAAQARGEKTAQPAAAVAKGR